mgnify:CR=1 FL=1
MGIVGFVVTMLAIAVTYLAWKNGKTTRENTEKILVSQRESTEKILVSQRESTEKILTAIKEVTKFIALLICAETPEEKRQLLKRIENL